MLLAMRNVSPAIPGHETLYAIIVWEHATLCIGHPNAKATPTLIFSIFWSIHPPSIYHNHTISDSYAIIQERIQKALATITPGTKPKVTRLTTEFNVPYDQLLNRYNKIPPKDSHSYALIDYKE